MKLTIIPFDGVDDTLVKAIARRLRRTLPWRFAVAPSLPEPRAGAGAAAVDVQQLFSLLPPGDRHDQLTLGLTSLNLATGDLEQVFGYAAPERRTAVVSLFRLNDGIAGRGVSVRLTVERAAKEILHEVGHLMALPHCEHAGCVMQYSQALHDTDIKQCGFCGDCLRELSRLPEPTAER
jgi:predicted Zn-dependent protease